MYPENYKGYNKNTRDVKHSENIKKWRQQSFKKENIKLNLIVYFSMNYYAVFTNHSGLNGVPVFLDCRLWEEIPKDPMAPVDKEFPWTIHIPRFAKITLPEKLNLIVKARKIETRKNRGINSTISNISILNTSFLVLTLFLN